MASVEETSKVEVTEVKSTPLIQMTELRSFGKMIADKFLEKIATHELVPIESVCTIKPYKKTNNRKFVKAKYYIVNEEKFNYSIHNGDDIKQISSNITHVIIVNNMIYHKFIGEYLHFISYTTDEPFGDIFNTIKVPVLNKDELDQYAYDINEIYGHIDGLSCYYGDFGKIDYD